MNIELESVARSYARLSYDVGGRVSFACDLNNDDALQVAEREQAHLDQAYFVLSFAALENQITSLACARLASEERRVAMREADFERRWDSAVRVAKEVLGAVVSWQSARSNVLSWYKIRSDIAHGRPPSQFANVPPVLYQADEIATTRERVAAALNG